MSVLKKIIPTKSTTSSAASGIVAAGVTFGVAEIISAFIAPTASPILALGSTFIDLTPSWLKTFAVETFGFADKLVLILSIAVVTIILAGLAGIIASKKTLAGLLIVAALGVVIVIAALTRPNADLSYALPAIIGVTAGIFTLSHLTKVNPYTARLRSKS